MRAPEARGRLGSTLILSALLIVVSPWSFASAQTSLAAQAQAIIAKVPTAGGGGAGLAIIRDGDRPPAGNGDSRRQYDSWDGNNAATEDWVGYTFASPQTFSRVVFQEGIHFWDGGWFLNLTVHVRQGTAWVPVQNLVSTPSYPGNNGLSYETYTLNFSPIQGDAVRLYGAPGGSAAFISVGELEVYGGGTPPSDVSVTAEAQATIAKVPTAGGGGAGLAIIRDGDRPPVGNGDSRRQYDSWDGNNPATEDWVGYTFATPKTFTRVVFQEGIHFWDGGWFLNLTVQVRQGTAWVPVQSLVSTPSYPGNNGLSYETYTLNFSPIQGDAIRLYGAPGGSAAFISIGELEVYATGAAGGGGGGTPPSDASVTAQVQAIIAKVPTAGGGGAGLTIIRDGDRPPAGNGDSRRQYDSWDGNNAATEDWVGYTFASPQTFTRVVFQEGIHFWDGGWFLNLTVQVRRGTAWVPVQSLVSTPSYPGNNGLSYETYTLNFSPIQGDAIRLYGAPGGSAAFISVGELEVFALAGEAGGGGSGPDLTVQSLAVSPGSTTPGGSLNITFTVRNAGTAAVGASSAGVYLASTPDASLPGIASLTTVSVPALASGASTVVATSASVPGGTAGAYFIIVAADPSGTILESAETNNRASATVNVAGAAGGITVWVVDTLTRVQPSDAPGSAGSASIKAARNEYEAFQIVVRAPSSGALANVDAVASDLVGPAVLSRANITLYRAHYVPVVQSSPGAHSPPGWWPDALIPFKHPETGQPLGGRFPAAPFPVPAGQNQPVWVEVFVPPGTPPGTYTGTVTLTASGVAPTTVPLTLTVWNFTLPATASVRSAFGELWTFWTKFGVQANTGAAYDIDWRIAQAALRHRVTVSRPGHTLGWFANDGTALPADAHMQEWLGTLGATSWLVPIFFADPMGADRAKMLRYLRTLHDYLAARGWVDRAFVYTPLTDEPGSAQDYQDIRNWAALVHEAHPNLRVLVTEQLTPENPAWGSLVGSADIWVPIFHSYNASAAQTLQAGGDEVWTYQTGAWNIAHPTWLLDYPILHYRIPLWMLWVNRIDGLLYWQTTYWSQVSDPWTDTRTYRDGTRVYNGEGSLFYPGNAVGYNGPIVSARLKALRDGMEDYEYLKILAGIIGVSGANSLATSVATSFASWNPSPANLQAIREAVAQRITNP